MSIMSKKKRKYSGKLIIYIREFIYIYREVKLRHSVIDLHSKFIYELKFINNGIGIKYFMYYICTYQFKI
jgi:hypothetical protein